MTDQKEQDAKDYEDLIARVAEIDPDAAEYMRTEARELPDFEGGGFLSIAFSWCDTPQGYRFWEALGLQLGEHVDY